MAKGWAFWKGRGLPFPATALALLALAQEGFRPGGKGQKTARKALERAETAFAKALAAKVLGATEESPKRP
jgi:hypothetical protein